MFGPKFTKHEITPIDEETRQWSCQSIQLPPNFQPEHISKVLERLALVTIIPHVLASSNFHPVQSAYRKRHSTETTLLKIVNDIYEGFDCRQSTILVALDQSAAFDCVDHSTGSARLIKNTDISLWAHLQGWSGSAERIWTSGAIWLWICGTDKKYWRRPAGSICRTDMDQWGWSGSMGQIWTCGADLLGWSGSGSAGLIKILTQALGC